MEQGAVERLARRADAQLADQVGSSVTGIGRPMWKPCAWSQSRSRSMFQTCPFSTPSATTVMPRLCARSMVERTIVASSASVCMLRTNDWSILSSLTGSRFR